MEPRLISCDWGSTSFRLRGIAADGQFLAERSSAQGASAIGVPGLALFGSHTTAERTGITRENFAAIEVARLSELPVERVLDAVHLRVAPSIKPGI